MINIKSLLGLEYYTSELDKFLAEFDAAHPKLSASQCAEIKKYDEVFKRRNDPKYTPHKNSLWEKF